MYICKGVASLVLEGYDNGCVGECGVVVRQARWVVYVCSGVMSGGGGTRR